MPFDEAVLDKRRAKAREHEDRNEQLRGRGEPKEGTCEGTLCPWAAGEGCRITCQHPKPSLHGLPHRREWCSPKNCKGHPEWEPAVEPAATEEEAAAFEGLIVVVMPARNEGTQVVETIRNFRKSKAPGTELKFALLNDASEDGCCERAKGARDVVYLESKKKQPTGQGIGRSRLVYATRRLEPRVWVSIDSHERMKTKYGLEAIALAAERTGAVVQARSGNLAKGNTLGWRGCRWALERHGSVIKPETRHDYRLKDKGLLPVQVLAGACYAFTWDTFQRLRGFGECFGYYGFFERDLAVNSYFLGMPQWCDSRVMAMHFYRKVRPYGQSGVWRVRGMVQCWRRAFRPEVWEEVWRPYVEQVQEKQRDPWIDYLLEALWLEDLQKQFEERKARTDEEVLAWMGVPGLEEADASKG